MRKLKLSLEDLSVQSFSTTWPKAAQRGTVRGAVNEMETLVIADTWVTCTRWPSYDLNGCDTGGDNGDSDDCNQSAHPDASCGYLCETNVYYDNCQIA